jgi:hypothetical protein
MHSQLDSVWEPEESLSVCMVPNSDVTKLNVIATFVTNLVLFLMTVIGLLRTRVRGSGMLNLGSFLWREVGGSIFPLAVVLSMR